MAEPIMFDATDCQDLERIIRDLDIGDVVKLYPLPGEYIEYRMAAAGAYGFRGCRVILAPEHLPDNYANYDGARTDIIERGDVVHTCPNFPGFVGVLRWISIPCMYAGMAGIGYIDQRGKKEWTSKSTIFLHLGMTIRRRPHHIIHDLVSVPRLTPYLAIDIHTLGAYEIIAKKVVGILPEPMERQLMEKSRGKRNTYEMHTTEEWRKSMCVLEEIKRMGQIGEIEEGPEV